LSALTVLASTPITGTPLSQLVQNAGGKVWVEDFPNSVSITALVPPDRVNAVVRAMTADFFAPVVDDAGFALGQRDDLQYVLYRSYDPSQAIQNAVSGAVFAGGPFHDGTLAPTAAISAITVPQVRTFAERAFRPGNAVLVLTGNLGDFTADYATRDSAAPTAEPLLTQPVTSAPADVQKTANVPGLGLGWPGPPITDEASATALDFVANALFAPKTGSVTAALGSLKADVDGTYLTYHDPGLFVVSISGDDAAAARPIVLRAIAQAATPMSPSAFAAARAAFEYRLHSEAEEPPGLADTLGWYAIEGNAAYAAGGDEYFGVVNALTPQSVARAARRYLSASPTSVTLVRPHPVPKAASS
jgi:predicted Zn-dependent peptidase